MIIQIIPLFPCGGSISRRLEQFHISAVHYLSSGWQSMCYCQFQMNAVDTNEKKCFSPICYLLICKVPPRLEASMWHTYRSWIGDSMAFKGFSDLSDFATSILISKLQLESQSRQNHGLATIYYTAVAIHNTCMKPIAFKRRLMEPWRSKPDCEINWVINKIKVSERGAGKQSICNEYSLKMLCSQMLTLVYQAY